MKNKIIFGIVFLLFIVNIISVFGIEANKNAYETVFNVEDKFTLYGTVQDDFNKGKFRIDKGIPAIFQLDITHKDDKTYTGGIVGPDDLDFHKCFNLTVSEDNQTIHGKCIFESDHTGTHFLYLNVSDAGVDTIYYWEEVEFTDALPSGYFWALVVLFVLCILGGLFITENIFILAILFLITAYINLVSTYEYLLGGNLFTALLLGSFILFVFLITYTLQKIFK